MGQDAPLRTQKLVPKKVPEKTSEAALPLDFYKVIVEHMTEALWVGDKEHKTRYVNPAFERLFGYRPDEWLGKHSYGYFDEKNVQKIQNANEIRKKGQPSNYEVEVLSKSGKSVPVLMSGAPTPDGGTVGIMTDLRKLKAMEDRYRHLVEFMKEGVWVGDFSDRTLYANPAFLDMLGYTMEEIYAKESPVFFAEDSLEVLNYHNALRRKRKESQYEAIMVSKTGERIPVLIHGVPFIEGVVATVTDLRLLKHLEKSEQEFQMFAQYSMDAMVSLDEKDMVHAWNVGAERMFGYSAEEILGKSITCIIPRERIENGELEYLYSETRKKGFVRNYETVRLHKNGMPLHVSLTYTMLRDKKGRQLGYSAVYRDITIQKQWEKDLQKRYDKMHEAYNEMGKLRRYVDYLVDLLDLGIGLSPGTDTAQFIVNAMLMFSKADAVILRRYDAHKKMLNLAATAGAVKDWQTKGPIGFSGSLAEETFSTKRPLKILDVTQEPLYSSPGFARKNNLRSLLLIPLFVQDEILGTISVYISSEKSLDVLDHEFIPLFAKQAALILKLAPSSL